MLSAGNLIAHPGHGVAESDLMHYMTSPRHLGLVLFVAFIYGCVHLLKSIESDHANL